MDSSVSLKDEIWFLHMCHHTSNACYKITMTVLAGEEGVGERERETPAEEAR